MVRTLTLCEYKTKENVPLAAEELRALSQIAPSISIKPRWDAPGHYDLTPAEWVGGIWLEDFSIVIEPKIQVDRLLFLLSYSLYRRTWHESPFQADPETDIVEAIVIAFLTHAERALRLGMLHGYRAEEGAQTTVRGRIRFDDQLRDYYGLAPPVCVRFDEFTDDIDENRLLKAAATHLLRIGLRSRKLSLPLLSILGAMPNVELVEYHPLRLPDIVYTRLNEYYRPCVELAKLILRSISFEIRHGTVAAGALLFDMTKVFEDFVVEALRDALGVSVSAFPQGRSLALDHAGKINLMPDLSWWAGPQCWFVGDVKYKGTTNADAQNADLYQLLAYVVATDLPFGLLIYAAGEARPEPYEVLHLSRTLDVVTLDLAGGPEGILLEIEEISGRIRQMRCLAETWRQDRERLNLQSVLASSPLGQPVLTNSR